MLQLNRPVHAIPNVKEGQTHLQSIFTVPTELSEPLAIIGNQSDLAILLLVVTGVMLLLSRLYNQPEVEVALPMLHDPDSGERRRDIRLIQGAVKLGDSFKDLLLRIRTEVSRVSQQEPSYVYAGGAVSEEAQPAAHAKTLVGFHPLHDEADLDPAAFGYTFAFHREGDRLELRLGYRSAEQAEERAAELADRWFVLMQEALRDPARPLSEIRNVTAAEEERLLGEFNATDKHYEQERMLHTWLEERAQEAPERTAVRMGVRQWSYGELNTRANQLARTLRGQGVVPDQAVAILANRSFAMLVAIHAVLKAGGAYLPIDPALPQERIRYLLQDSQASLVLAETRELADVVLPGWPEGHLLLALDDEAQYAADGSDLRPAATARHLAYIIYTSGSTGMPKGVMVEHRSVINRLQWMQDCYPLTEADVLLQKTPYSFDVSVWELFWWSAAGASVCLLEPGGEKDPEEIIRTVEEQRVSVVHFVPSMLSLFLEHLAGSGEGARLRSLKRVFTSGEALQPQQVADFRHLVHARTGTALVNLYGPTEATVDVSHYDCMAHPVLSTVPIGRPIANIRLYVLDDAQRLQPIGVAGELWIAGDGLARGYWNRPELTADKFVANPFEPEGLMYRTGDLACWLADGSIAYKGRIDHQVKIRGYRIECGEIEYHLLRHPAIREAVVCAGRHERGDAYLCAYIVSTASVSQAEVHAHLAHALPDYMIPAYTIRLERMPLTPNGKADRAALPKPSFQSAVNGTVAESAAAYEVDTLTDPAAPEIEKETARMAALIGPLWNAELGLDGPVRETNFFLLGGDSIKVIRLISQVNKVFQVAVKSRDFYREPTLLALCGLVREQQAQGRIRELETGLAAIAQLKASILQDPVLANELPQGWSDFYPLSSIQQSMVFYSRLRPSEPIYHDQFCYQFAIASFQHERFQQTLQLLTDKHPILRTTFLLTKFSEAVQVVHQRLVPAYRYEDLAGLTEEAQIQHIQDRMKADLADKYRFDHDVLWRMQLYRIHADSYCIMLSFHHAVLDGWSVASFISEFAETYSRLSLGLAVSDEPLEASYRDYVAVQLGRHAGEETQQFWKTELAGYTRNKLPFNFTGKKLQELPSNRIIRRTLDAESLQTLERKAQSLGCTLMELTFAAHLYLLRILTTEPEIMTGLVTHDRPDLTDGERILGCFLNTIPFRLQVGKTMDKQELVDAVGRSLRRIKPHELFLADISAAAGERHQRENPFFDCLFNFIDMHVLTSVAPGTDAPVRRSERELDIGSNEMTNTLFDLEVSKTLNRLEIQLKYSPNHFYDSEMDTAFALYLRILTHLGNEDTKLAYADILLEEQTTFSLYGFNQTQTAYPRDYTLHRLFEEQAERAPDRIALTFEGGNLTYRELDVRSNQLARQLLAMGVRVDDSVGLCVQRGMDMIIAMLAILKSGAAYVPIDPDFPQNRIAYIAESAGVKIVIIDASVTWTHPITVLQLEEGTAAEQPAAPLQTGKSSNELAYIIYTSGSTGMPKGVMIEHHAAVNLVLEMNRRFAVTADDSLLFLTSMCFDLSVYDVFGILAAGGRVVIARKSQTQSPLQLIKLLDAERITIWDSVPTTLNHLMQYMEETGIRLARPALRMAWLSGDWIPVGLAERVRRQFPEASVIALGGATEATVWSNYYPIGEVTAFQSSIPYGKPIGNNYFYILDDELRPLPAGVAGELYIGGAGVARGYMGDPERTARAFLRNPFLSEPGERMYKTGDLGRMLPDGNMAFLGRKDHQVKIRGYRVELGEIESQLCKLEPVKEACVVDLKDANETSYLCAYVVVSREIGLVEIKEQLSKVLPGYMLPGTLVQLPQLPLTANGKIDRAALPAPAMHQGDASNYAPPRHETDERLISIWQQVLNVDHIGIHDNFFELGGHSLLAVKLEIEVEKYTHMPMDMFTFTYQTIREQSDFLQTERGKADEAGLRDPQPVQDV